MESIYQKRLLVTALLSSMWLAGIAIYNVVMDPYNLWNIVDRWDTSKELSQSSQGKYHMLEGEKCDFVIAGNSRAEMGFAPLSPVLSTYRACNLGFSGAKIGEMAQVVERAIQFPSLRILLLAVDSDDFSQYQLNSTGISNSLFNPRKSKVEYFMGMLFGGGILKSSIRLNKNIVNNRTFPFESTRGHLNGPSKSLPKTLKERIELRIRVSRNPRVYSEQFLIRKDPYSEFSDLLDRILAKDIRLILIINPRHALAFDISGDLNGLKKLEEFKGRLTHIVESKNRMDLKIYDFATYNSITTKGFNTTDPMDNYFWEHSHYKSNVGDQILSKVLGKLNESPSRNITSLNTAEDPLFGVALTNKNLNEVMSLNRKLQAKWKSERIQLGFSWVDTLLESFNTNPNQGDNHEK